LDEDENEKLLHPFYTSTSFGSWRRRWSLQPPLAGEKKEERGKYGKEVMKRGGLAPLK